LYTGHNMKAGETKSGAFIRLATKRSNRILKDISLLGNLSERSNYSFEETQVKKIFTIIDEELRHAKSRFGAVMKRERKIKL